MPTYAQQMKRLKRIILIAEKLIADSPKPKIGRPSKTNGKGAARNGRGKRIRRSGQELAAFRKMLKTARRKGVSASTLAKKHGVSLTYIYQL